MTKTVALLVGGWSEEREVSLEKGKAVEAALIEAGYTVRTIIVRKNLHALIEALTPLPDVIFNNLHGRGGEDGIIQGVLEMIGVPYTHSGVLASAIGMNKAICRIMASSVGVRVAKGSVAAVSDILAGKVLPVPYVVKPVQEGSSVGVRIVREGDNSPAIASDWHYGESALVEEYIPGKELTVAVLDGKAQAVTEIVSQTGFFDYEAKYKDTRTELVMPAQIPADVYNKALEYAEAVYNVCGCRGLARCDFRYDDSTGDASGLCFLEINTQPGCTPQSIGPSQVIYNGLSFSGLCAHLVETASCLDPVPAEHPSSTDAQDKKRA